MGLSTKVLLNGVNNLSDARYGAGMGVSFMSFALQRGMEAYVSLEDFNEIVGWVEGPLIGGELDDLPLEEFWEEYRISFVMTANPQVARIARLKKKKIVFRIQVEEIDHINASLSGIDFDYILLESKNDIVIDINLLKEVSQKYKIILGSGLSENNIDDQVEAGIVALGLKGGEEIRPGYKDFDELADILEYLDED